MELQKAELKCVKSQERAENSCRVSVRELLVNDASVKIVSNSDIPQGYSVDIF